MNQKVTTTIESIGNEVIDKFYEQDDFDIAMDFEYGGTDATIGVHFEFMDCEIDANVWYHANSKTEMEVLLYPKKNGHNLSLLEEAVNDYVKKNIFEWELLDSMREKARKASYDEWEEHGFRDAADYYHWRYG